MSNEVFLAVILAAMMNATWNSAVKAGGDKIAVMTITTLIGSLFSLLFLPFVILTGSISWILLLISITIHTAYHLVLAIAYQHGDLGHIYPIARGGAPLLVTIAAAILIREIPSWTAMAGVACLCSGVLGFAFHRQGRCGNRGATLYALLTSVLISGYTVVDALGARQSESALAFAVLLTIGDGIATALIVLRWKGVKTFHCDRKTWQLSAIAGAMQIGAYWIAVWALTQAPMGSVSALRESSVLFVVLISTFLLKEKFDTQRFISSLFVFFGIVLVRIGH